MTKHFCDLCSKELSDNDYISIRPYIPRYQLRIICLDCLNTPQQLLRLPDVLKRSDADQKRIDKLFNTGSQ